MKKLTMLWLSYILFVGTALLINSCKRDPDIQNQSRLTADQNILKAKAHVESLIQQQGPDAFVKKMGFQIIWEKAITDSAGNIRVPMYLDFNNFKPKYGKRIPASKTRTVFELYIKNNKGQNEVSIMQFMNFKGKYYPLRYTLAGEGKTKINLSGQDIAMLSKKGNGNKGLSSGLNKTMIYQSEVITLIKQMYGPSFSMVLIYQCTLGTLYNPATCDCDLPENVVSGETYPEFYMMIIIGGLYDLVPYPFSFHPSEIEVDPEYPDEPIGGGDGGNDGPGTYDCAGVLNGTAYMADCGCIGGTTGITECPEIINNVTDTCLFKIAKLVLDNNMVGEIANIISALDSNTTVKVKIYDASENPNGSAGQTSNTSWTKDPQNGLTTNFMTNITLSRSLLLESTKEHVAVILIHEIVHAYFRKSTSKAEEFDGKDHQDMATNYINPIANFLTGLFGLSLTDATALAWNTVADADAFKNANNFTIGSGPNATIISKDDLQVIATNYTLNQGGTGNGTCK